MKHIIGIIDFLAKYPALFFIVFFLIIGIFIYIGEVLKNFFIDLVKIVLLIYAVYFPFGAFMGIYYLIITKDLFCRENIFTFMFIVSSVFNIFLIINKYLLNISIKRFNSKLKYMPKSFFSYMYEPEYLEGKFDVVTYITLYLNFSFLIYTVIQFFKSIIHYIK